MAEKSSRALAAGRGRPAGFGHKRTICFSSGLVIAASPDASRAEASTLPFSRAFGSSQKYLPYPLLHCPPTIKLPLSSPPLPSRSKRLAAVMRFSFFSTRFLIEAKPVIASLLSRPHRKHGNNTPINDLCSGAHTRAIKTSQINEAPSAITDCWTAAKTSFKTVRRESGGCLGFSLNLNYIHKDPLTKVTVRRVLPCCLVFS